MAGLEIKKTSRLTSLDFFRGFAVLFMVFFNIAGYNGYALLRHSPWHGWTFADTIFPFFLWIIGVAMVFSFAKRASLGEDKKKLFLHILKRSLILFILGLFINLLPYFDLSTVQIMGVLQRIGIVYFFAGIALLYLKPKWQAGLTIFLLIVYWLLLIFIPVPGFGPGILDRDGNLVQYLDTLILKGHMGGQNWDPEGILSTIPAISTMLFGVLAGQLLISKKSSVLKAYLLLLSGISLVILGLVLNIWLPINKNLWTSSFSVFMAGLAFVFFGISYWIIDVKGFKRWTFPFVICGMNAILLYFFGGLIAHLFYGIGENMKISTQQNIFLFFGLISICITFLVAYILYRHKLFLKI